MKFDVYICEHSSGRDKKIKYIFHYNFSSFMDVVPTFCSEVACGREVEARKLFIQRVKKSRVFFDLLDVFAASKIT